VTTTPARAWARVQDLGELNDAHDNAMVICHALTGSADIEDWYVLFLFPPVSDE
jgi:homoserine acetyltransferase